MTRIDVEPLARTLPYRWYDDASVAEAERDAIFRRTWQHAGHLGELDGPGSLFPTHAGGVPVVVTLDRDGALRAFVNVCRHRGALVAAAPQRRGTLQCPYHAWTYGLDGALRAAPRSDLEPCFERDGLGLLPVAVDTWGPFLFVNPDPDAEPLAAALGDLPAVPARLSQFAPVHPRAPNGGAAYDARGALSDSQFHLLLAATKLNVCPGRPNLSIGPVWPVAPDRCAGYLDYFFGADADADAEWIAAFTGSSSRRHGPTTRRGPGRATLRA